MGESWWWVWRLWRKRINKYERTKFVRGVKCCELEESSRGRAFVEGVQYLFSRSRKLRQRSMNTSTMTDESLMVDRSRAYVE